MIFINVLMTYCIKIDFLDFEMYHAFFFLPNNFSIQIAIIAVFIMALKNEANEYILST